MSTGLSLARQLPQTEEEERMLVRIGEAADSGQAMVLELVGSAKRVLDLGGPTALVSSLREQGCEVVTVAADAIADRPELPGDGFDVVLAFGVLEYLRDPLAALQAVRPHLRREGYLVVAVPNVAHGSVRLALLDGRFPFGAAEPAQTPLRFFTYEHTIELVEKAGFAIGTVQRQEEDVSAPEGAAESVLDLLDSVSAAPEARTWRFLVVAHALPSGELSWLQERLRALAEQHSTARREADELRQDLESVNGHLHLLLEQQQAALARDKELRTRVLELHEQLAQRDEELRSLHRSFQEQLTQRDEAARSFQQSCQDQLGQRGQYILELEARLDRFRRTPLGRVYRVLRRVKRAVVRR